MLSFFSLRHLTRLPQLLLSLHRCPCTASDMPPIPWTPTARSSPPQICLDHYLKAAAGMRKHMVTRIRLVDGAGSSAGDAARDGGNSSSEPELWLLAEVDARQAGSTVAAGKPGPVMTKNPRLEHLTCFTPGLLALGECSLKGFPISPHKGIVLGRGAGGVGIAFYRGACL